MIPSAEALESLQHRLGYVFRDADLLLQALTHPSYNNTGGVDAPNNQRLEFLGDALIAAHVAETLYRVFPDYREGGLTEARAGLIEGAHLAQLARNLELPKVLRVGPTEGEQALAESQNALEDAFEALVGALFLDGGWDAVNGVLQRVMGDPGQHKPDPAKPKNPKGKLQQILQQSGAGRTPEYEVVSRSGPPHAPIFRVQVSADGRVIGEGEGSSKKEAEMQAARAALEDDSLPACM